MTLFNTVILWLVPGNNALVTPTKKEFFDDLENAFFGQLQPPYRRHHFFGPRAEFAQRRYRHRRVGRFGQGHLQELIQGQGLPERGNAHVYPQGYGETIFVSR
ncbi:hypothetical protein A2837_01095 [Candidatus Kaiserbacteria bacterium RIFCSPHIGHO2_01_FULL_46_22]|uniref:Uncharacterized protein n=1 Tax=Candidatus Kaiserbacteria bacterium RIFCSPHIGHO2_01_FULL_46_22 TaxID=1798475 RepID=A0A1F6BY99_9BACT|nr:MAG: hypothetical protein A2837_01095 [Candidatus Kaiserbacteria bacterium RIFCSPHIGHO2_01_FULL_46_22]